MSKVFLFFVGVSAEGSCVRWGNVALVAGVLVLLGLVVL